MRGTVAALPAILALLIVPAQLSAKGHTVRITIKGGDLAAPIEITDPEVIAGFRVWSGPGTSSNEAQGAPEEDRVAFDVSYVEYEFSEVGLRERGAHFS